MGVFFRKAFRLGPLRFNLSKSGVGMSAGVKGARAGIDAKGRRYVAGGRSPIYFRKYLKNGAANPAAPTPSGPRPRSSLLALFLVALLVLIVLAVFGR